MTPYQRPATGDEHGGGGRWVAGFVLALVLAAAFSALMLYLITSEGAAREAHRRIVDALAEGDALFVPERHDDFLLRAEASEPGEALRYPDWPVQVTVTREEALASTPESLRTLLLDRSATALYAEGTGVLRDPEATGEPGRFSAAGIVDSFMDVLREDMHGAAFIAMIVLFLLAAVVGGVVGMLTRGYGRVIAIGIAALAGALPVLAVSAMLHAYMRVSGDTDTEYLRLRLLDVGEELSAVTVTAAAAITVASGAVVVLGMVCARWADSRTTGHGLERRTA